MCGRYVASSPTAVLAERFEVDEVKLDDDLDASWNVAPTDRVPAVARARDGRTLLGAFRWGLVPSWASDTKGAARHINARAETVADSPAFRDAFAKRRCLVPADGFYEWRKPVAGSKVKQPVFIERTDGDLMVFAGLWDFWRDRSDRDGPFLRTCTIVTTTASDTIASVHDRMPVILAPDDWAAWLDNDDADLSYLHSLLVPAPAGAVSMREVRPLVNSVRNNGPELLDPA